jgi:hypothetical protein
VTLEDLIGRDPNQLPYFVTRTRGGEQVRVRFERLTETDLQLPSGDAWVGAVFHSFWMSAAVTALGALKLTAVSERGDPTLGLLLPGTIKRSGAPLQDSLLETAPRYRYRHGVREYRGVGRVLVARLVVESLLDGGQGAVRVRSRPEVQGFYACLGFRHLPGTRHVMVLEAARGAQLLAEVLSPGNESSG